jgi:hypothetical protein
MFGRFYPSNHAAHSHPSRLGWLDRKLPLVARIAILVVACLIPVCYVSKHYDSQRRFSSLILFGAKFQDAALPEIKAMEPAVDSPYGYDGQFYVQIALDPLLKNPQLRKALDIPGYRVQRIMLPTLSYLLGFGKPAVIVQVYALLNLLFWFMLLFGLVHYLHASTPRDYLCILTIVFTTGALISVQRSLTDLPAATLGFFASALSGASACLMMSMAILTRETSAMFLLKFAWPLPKDRSEVFALTFRAALVIAPLALWLLYVHYSFGASFQDTGAFGWPFRGWALHVYTNWKALNAMPLKFDLSSLIDWQWHMFELLALLSAMVQAFCFAIWRSPRCAYWRMGVGFAVMFIFFTSCIFEEQIAFCRAVLPMTIAFNIGLMRLKGSAFALNFIAGNLGLAWGFINTLGTCLIK